MEYEKVNIYLNLVKCIHQGRISFPDEYARFISTDTSDTDRFVDEKKEGT